MHQTHVLNPWQLDQPPIDPDMNASLIDLMAKSIPRYMKGLIMVPRETSDLFVNAMRGLMADETPQKAVSAHFWVNKNSIGHTSS